MNNAPTLVRDRRGVAVTDSLTIAREFGRRHDNVLQSLDSLAADGTISPLEFKGAEYLDEQGKPRRMLELTERAALVAMPFIGGRKSRIGQVRLVDAFLALRAALDEKRSIGWAQARQHAAAHYVLLSDALVMRREAEGKQTLPHHFSNEARLVNLAFSGEAGPIDRNALSKADLRMLAQIERRGAAMILEGKPYAERKAALRAYAGELRGGGVTIAHQKGESPASAMTGGAFMRVTTPRRDTTTARSVYCGGMA